MAEVCERFFLGISDASFEMGACELQHYASLALAEEWRKQASGSCFQRKDLQIETGSVYRSQTHPYTRLYFGCCWISIFAWMSSVAKQMQRQDKKKTKKKQNRKLIMRSNLLAMQNCMLPTQDIQNKKCLVSQSISLWAASKQRPYFSSPSFVISSHNASINCRKAVSCTK